MNPFQDLFNRQKGHFATGVTRSRGWRIEQLDRMGRLLAENEAVLQQAIGQDFKTASQEQIFETLECLGEVAFQKSQLEEWMKPIEAPVPLALAAMGHRGVVYRDPYGVALIIGPFNGPLLLLLRPAISALAAGNCCVLKLSMAVEATSSLLMELVPKYFEPEAVAAVAGHREETTELLKLPFDFIFFTGSTSTGKVVARAAAENLTPVVLELGGQNPALVDEAANIKDSAKKIVWGAMAWGGQWCTSPGYAYVHGSIAEEFVAEAKAALTELFGEDPKSNSDYSRVISAREVTRYQTLDEAFGRIAATPNPLAAFIFSREQKTIDRFIRELSFGGGAVNQVNIHLFIETMPFGGVGPAGMGRYYGKYGFDMLTHAKSMLISPPDVAIDHLFPPYTSEKNAARKQWFEY
jgi:aldehyde dehydrogenase (NAD+)